LLDIVNKNVLYNNKLFKIFKLSRVYIYAFKYIKQKELIVNDDILTYTFGKQHIYSSYKNELDNYQIKILVSSFYNYVVLNNDTDIENIFTFSNGNSYNNNYVFYNYKESIFYKNSDYLKYLYDICLLIKSIISETMNINNDYYNEKRKDLIQKLKFQLDIDKIKYDVSDENFLNALSEYSINFLNEKIDYNYEYNNIISVQQI
jgi:hypothetical protein